MQFSLHCHVKDITTFCPTKLACLREISNREWAKFSRRARLGKPRREGRAEIDKLRPESFDHSSVNSTLSAVCTTV